uniref:Uncharacterized protein n=1 Tax=Spongospora subterranea TaxID=70186 RepID=A0A0H5RAR7_9EUKA|eukprot:CRZ11260.1 hypothetical protein [Spongospora subterranea]
MKVRRFKENLGNSWNLPPKNTGSITESQLTPQKAKAELLNKDREIEKLRRLLENKSSQNKKSIGDSYKNDAKRLSDILDRQKLSSKKIEESVVKLRQGSWASQTDRFYVQEILDVLQSALVILNAPLIPAEALVHRRHSMSAQVPVQEDFTQEFSSMEQIISLEKQLCHSRASLEAASKRELEIEGLVSQLGEACRLSEKRANEFQAKYESLQSSIDRTQGLNWARQLREAEESRTNAINSLTIAECHISELKIQLATAEKLNKRAGEMNIDLQVANQKVQHLLHDIAEERNRRELQDNQVERMTRENARITTLLSQREEKIRELVCASHIQKDAEREQLLNNINVANTAVSTLKLELLLKTDALDSDSDQDDADDVQDHDPLTASMTDLSCFQAIPANTFDSRLNLPKRNIPIGLDHGSDNLSSKQEGVECTPVYQPSPSINGAPQLKVASGFLGNMYIGAPKAEVYRFCTPIYKMFS